MRAFMQKPKSQQTASADFTRPGRANPEQTREINPALHLQRRIGNEALQWLLQANAAGAIQARLTISQPQDQHEQEADRVSEQIMRMPEPQRADGTHTGHQTAQTSNGLERVHAKRAEPGDADNASALPLVQDALCSPGRPLDAKTREFFEPRFGYDLGEVRVHTGEKAEQSASAIGAAAYTAGTEIVFGSGRYAPETSEGKHLLAHELTHTIQQGLQSQAPAMLQRRPEPRAPKPPADKLQKSLKALVDKKVTDYPTYKTAISKATADEKKVALLDQGLLSAMNDLLGHMSFARCVEALGRRAPNFNQLQKISVVATALQDAWKASDVGVRDLVTQPHEEGGWVFMNLIDGSFSIERAQAVGTNFIKVEPPPDVKDSVLVAIFHTHPTLVKKPGPSPDDLKQDKRRGVPNLVAASTTGKPDVFKIYLSGPAARKHLASDTKIPGPSGGIAP
jgi:hypothetical protein